MVSDNHHTHTAADIKVEKWDFVAVTLGSSDSLRHFITRLSPQQQSAESDNTSQDKSSALIYYSVRCRHYSTILDLTHMEELESRE